MEEREERVEEKAEKKAEEKVEGKRGEDKREVEGKADRSCRCGFKQVLMVVFVVLVLLGGYHYYLVNYVIPRIKVFDLLGNLGVIQNAYVSGRIGDQELQGILNELKVFLEREGKGRNVYILPSQVVLNREATGELKFVNSRLENLIREQASSSFLGSPFGNQLGNQFGIGNQTRR